MRSRLGIVSILLLLIPHCFAAWCRTCRGQECQQKDLKLRACNKFSSTLPYGTHSILPKSKENLQYGCLKLEYIHGKSTEIVQQCIIAENINTYCEDIEKKIFYTSCKVETPINLKTKRETNSLLVQTIEATNNRNRDSNVTGTDTFTDYLSMNIYYNTTKFPTVSTPHKDEITRSASTISPLEVNTTRYNDLAETTTKHYFKNESESTKNISFNSTTENIYSDNITAANFGSLTMQPSDSSVGDEIEVIDDNGNLPVITTAQSIAPEHDINNLEVSTTHLFPAVISYTTTTGYNDLTETTTEHYIKNESESTKYISLDLTTEKVYTDKITTDNFGSSTMQQSDSSFGDETEVVDDNENLPVITTAQSIAFEHDNDNLEVSTTHLFPEVISYTTTTGYNDLTETKTEHYIKNESESTTNISLDLTTEKVYTDNITTDNFGSSTMQPNDSNVGDEIEVIDDNGNLPVITTAQSIAPEHYINNLEVSTTHLFPEVISYTTITGYNDLTETTTEHYIKNESESTQHISLEQTTEKVYTDKITTDNFGSSTMQQSDSSFGDETEVIDDIGILPVITTAQSIAPEHDNNNLEVSTTHLFPEVISYTTTTGYNDLNETTTDNFGSTTMQRNDSSVGDEIEVIDGNGNLPVNTTAQSSAPEHDNNNLEISTTHLFPEVISYTDNITTDNFGSSTMQPNDSSVGDEIEVIDDNGNLPVITTAQSIAPEHDINNLEVSTTHLFPEVISYTTTSGYNDLTETTTEHYIKNESESTKHILLDLTTEKVYTDKITTYIVGSSTMQQSDSSFDDETEVIDNNGNLPVITTSQSIAPEHDNNNLEVSTTHLFPEVISYTTTTGYNDLTETTTEHYIKNESESTTNISLDLTTEKVYTDKITTDNFGSSTMQQSDSSFGDQTEVIDDNGNLSVITTAQSITPEHENNNLEVSTTHLFPEVISYTTTTGYNDLTETTTEHYIKNESESTTNISLDLTTEKVYTDKITTDNFGSSTMQQSDSRFGDEAEVIDDNGNLPVITTAQSIAPEHDNNNLEVSTTHSEVISYTTTTGYNDLTETTTEHYIKNESESTTNIFLDLTTGKVYTDKITTDSFGSSTMQPNDSSFGDEIKVTADNGSLPVTTTVHSIVLEHDNDSLSISTTYLFPEMISNSTSSTIFPSNGVDADHSNSDSSTEIPSNIPSFENTTPLIIIENSDSILIDEDDQFTQTEASDHAQVPFDLDHDGDHNSALNNEFPFILCAALFVIYTVVS